MNAVLYLSYTKQHKDSNIMKWYSASMSIYSNPLKWHSVSMSKYSYPLKWHSVSMSKYSYPVKGVGLGYGR